jgi:lipoyl(octanoyl) transferase
MPGTPFDADLLGPAVEAHLLGRVDFGRCLELQERLAGEAAGRTDGRIVLLLCEHPEIITLGRGGSAGDVELDSRPVRTRRLEVRWVKRGGGALVHAPGQLAAYPIVPLRWHGFSVGEYLDLLQNAVVQTIRGLGIPVETRPDRHGVWGRTGQLAVLGVAVRDWVAWHGAYVNVCPPMGLFKLVDADPRGHTPMGCLVAEHRKPVRMTSVRVELIRHLTDALGCTRYHLHTGHPYLRTAVSRRA